MPGASQTLWEGDVIGIRKLVESRSKRRRWIYLLCATVALFMALWAAPEGIISILPYLLVLVLCVVQFLRPVLLICLF